MAGWKGRKRGREKEESHVPNVSLCSIRVLRIWVVCRTAAPPAPVSSLSLSCCAVILDYLASKRISTGDLVVVSPDVGGVARARAFAKKLNDAPLAIVDKRRSAHNVSEVMNLIGDVRGKVAVLVDDMIDTAGALRCAPLYRTALYCSVPYRTALCCPGPHRLGRQGVALSPHAGC